MDSLAAKLRCIPVSDYAAVVEISRHLAEVEASGGRSRWFFRAGSRPRSAGSHGEDSASTLDGSWLFSQYFNGMVLRAPWEVCVMSIDERWRGLNPIDAGSGLREPIRWAKEIVLA